METFFLFCGWVGSVLKGFATMRTNDSIVSWLMGNAVLIGMILIIGTARAAATKSDTDNKFWLAIRKALFFAAPDMPLPEEEKQPEESEVHSEQEA